MKKLTDTEPTTERPTSLGSRKRNFFLATGLMGTEVVEADMLVTIMQGRNKLLNSSSVSALRSTQRDLLGALRFPSLISELGIMLSGARLLHACKKRHVFEKVAYVPLNSFQPRKASTRLKTFANQYGRKEKYHTTYNFIGNELIASKCTEWIDLHDPATGKIVSKVPQSTDAELLRAVDCAKDTFPSWRDTCILKR